MGGLSSSLNVLPALASKPERVQLVHEVTQEAFAPYATLKRPSRALRETVDDVAADLRAGGGLLAFDWPWSNALGALRWTAEDDHLWVKRVAVRPSVQRRGIGDVLMAACRGVAFAHTLPEIRLGIRHELAGNRAWYERLGYSLHRDHDDWSEFRRAVRPLTFSNPVPHEKYEWPDKLQSRTALDVLEESPAGLWVATPQFNPAFSGGDIVWLPPRPVVGFLPADRWWAAWWQRGFLKIDICEPAGIVEGVLTMRDLSLDVVLEEGQAAMVVDEDEFAEHCDGGTEVRYPDEVVDAARRAAEEVLALMRDRGEPFATEGPRRLQAYEEAPD